MAVALEQFVAQLEDSGILSGDTLKDFLPPKGEPKDAEELARELVRKKKLTKFQAEEVYRGKGKSLTLGNYVLMEKIGAGGMGQVFKARHRRMDRIVAVKLLPAEMTKDQEAIARFEREVKAAAKISHPNIVAAYDADQAGGVHFLVMELVDGSDLSALVKKNGPLPVDKGVSYILQAARGLEAAHAEGIVHRDIKPANLLLGKNGVVKILDMGLARLSGDVDAQTQAELTSTGAVMGTVDYMAPEQALSTRSADARADIYSLGCTLFYLLTGKATFGGDSLMAKLLAHREQPIPSLRSIRPEIPESVEAIFEKMLAKKVEDRYQTMTEVVAALEHYGPSQEPSGSTLQSLGSSTDEGLTNFLRDTSLAPKRALSRRNPSISQSDKERLERLLVRSGIGVLALLLLLAGVTAAVVVRLQTKDGTLVVTVNEPGATVQVLDAEGKVEITRQGEKSPVTISVDPGKHRLMVEKDGFQFFTKDFEIASGGKQPITARLVPLKRKPATVAGTKPAPTGPPTIPATSPKASGPRQLLAFEKPGFEQWMKEVEALPGEAQVKAVVKKLQELNAGFDGKETHKVEIDDVTEINFVTDDLIDISPVRAIQGLKVLKCAGTRPQQGKLTDLAPLQGMKLTDLSCVWTSVSDLSPLRGMNLRCLDIYYTQVSDLSPLSGMQLTKLNCIATQVIDLSPLQGIPLTEFYVESTKVADLSPLTGMKLAVLNCGTTRVSDFAPLKGMPLKVLVYDFKPFRDTDLLRSIKTLEAVNYKPIAEFWKEVDSQQAAFDAWTKQVKAMSAENQVKAVIKKLLELNSGFDGKEVHDIENGVVTHLQLLTDNLTDISPVRGLAGLKVLECGGAGPGSGRLADLSPLAGMQLVALNCQQNPVSDLSPLRGMPLTMLSCGWTKVSDLSPLKDMPLGTLYGNDTQVRDLTPLIGSPITHLYLANTPVSDLSALRMMPLITLGLTGTKVSTLLILRDLKLEELGCDNTPVSDLSPIKEMPLKILVCTFHPFRDANLIRSMKTLERINQKPTGEFWKEVDAQQAAFDAWTKQVATMPAEEQVKAVVKKLQELNQGFDGKEEHLVENDVVTTLKVVTDNVADISPVRALAGLKSLNCGSSETANGKLADLWPLKGVPLTGFWCGGTQVTDLSPLRGMPLNSLNFQNTKVFDLSPLKGMPLTELACHATQVSYLSPLRDMKLTTLLCYGTKVSDLAPLKDMPLKTLCCDFKPERDAELIRSIKTLEQINFKPAAEFWKDVDGKK